MKYVGSLLILILFALGPALRAQQPSGGDGGGGVFAGNDSYEGTGIKRYRLGPGDIVELRVYGQPEFSGPLAVDVDGYIELPFVDKPIFAKCRTDREIKKEITEQLTKYIKRPQVNVRVTERRSRPPAIVYGAVRSAQRVMMNRQVKLLELLAVAGGVTDQAGSEIQIFHTESVMCPGEADDPEEAAQLQLAKAETEAPASEGEQSPEKSASENTLARVGDSTPTAGNDSQIADGSPTKDAAPNTDDDAAPPVDPMRGKFDLYSLADLRAGRPEANPKIRPGDIVIVPEASPIYVTGAVTSPQGLVLRDQMSLRYAISMVGGLRKDAKGGSIRIFRRKVGVLKPEVIKVDYNAIKNQKQQDVALQAYDIIDVPSSTITPANILQMLLGTGTSSLANMGASLPYRVLY
jgi:polysaccharide export outer membrane protein